MYEQLSFFYSYKDAIAMVTTAQGKYYSLGLDLEELITLSPPQLAEFSDQLQKLLARLLTFPMVTVAALNGTCVESISHNIIRMFDCLK